MMQRARYDTVTEKLPVLVPASEKEMEGWATFLPEIGSPDRVRTLKDDDLCNPQKHLNEIEVLHFSAVLALSRALDNVADTIALKNAHEKLEKAQQLHLSKDRRLSTGVSEDAMQRMGAALAHLTGLPPQEAIAHFEGIRPGKRAREDLRWLLSYEISKVLDEARFVLWYPGNALKPAIWCPSIRVAFYVHALLSVAGGKGLRICPHCSKAFLQERPDQNYCSIAHREAHRVARWRFKKKQATGRKHNGPRKTR